jgi:hypothetical protein
MCQSADVQYRLRHRFIEVLGGFRASTRQPNLAPICGTRSPKESGQQAQRAGVTFRCCSVGELVRSRVSLQKLKSKAGPIALVRDR